MGTGESSYTRSESQTVPDEGQFRGQARHVFRSQSKQYKGIGRLEDRTGAVVRQAGSESGQARVETRMTRNKRDWRKKIGARKTVG